MMKKVVVTGGGGFIGKALVRKLIERGVEITVIGRNRYPDLAAMGVRCLQGDVREASFLNQAVAGCDTVFHVAAKAGIWGAAQEYYSINVMGTQNVIAACRKQGVPHLVYTSTPSVVFDRKNLEGVDETAPYATKPLCHYAASKIKAEQAVLQAQSNDLHTIALRPHLVWGPGDRHLVPRLLERGRAGALSIVGSGANRVDIAYIDNVVHAHILAAENLHTTTTGAGQAFFIGQEEPVLLWQWINALFVKMEIPQVARRVPFAVAYALGGALEGVYSALRLRQEPKMTRFLASQLAHSHWFSHERAKEVLGYRQQVTTEQGVDRLVDWFKRECERI